MTENHQNDTPSTQHKTSSLVNVTNKDGVKQRKISLVVGTGIIEPPNLTLNNNNEMPLPNKIKNNHDDDSKAQKNGENTVQSNHPSINQTKSSEQSSPLLQPKEKTSNQKENDDKKEGEEDENKSNTTTKLSTDDCKIKEDDQQQEAERTRTTTNINNDNEYNPSNSLEPEPIIIAGAVPQGSQSRTRERLARKMEQMANSDTKRQPYEESYSNVGDDSASSFNTGDMKTSTTPNRNRSREGARLARNMKQLANSDTKSPPNSSSLSNKSDDNSVSSLDAETAKVGAFPKRGRSRTRERLARKMEQMTNSNTKQPPSGESYSNVDDDSASSFNTGDMKPSATPNRNRSREGARLARKMKQLANSDTKSPPNSLSLSNRSDDNSVSSLDAETAKVGAFPKKGQSRTRERLARKMEQMTNSNTKQPPSGESFSASSLLGSGPGRSRSREEKRLAKKMEQLSNSGTNSSRQSNNLDDNSASSLLGSGPLRNRSRSREEKRLAKKMEQLSNSGTNSSLQSNNSDNNSASSLLGSGPLRNRSRSREGKRLAKKMEQMAAQNSDISASPGPGIRNDVENDARRIEYNFFESDFGESEMTLTESTREACYAESPGAFQVGITSGVPLERGALSMQPNNLSSQYSFRDDSERRKGGNMTIKVVEAQPVVDNFDQIVEHRLQQELEARVGGLDIEEAMVIIPEKVEIEHQNPRSSSNKCGLVCAIVSILIIIILAVVVPSTMRRQPSQSSGTISPTSSPTRAVTTSPTSKPSVALVFSPSVMPSLSPQPTVSIELEQLQTIFFGVSGEEAIYNENSYQFQALLWFLNEENAGYRNVLLSNERETDIADMEIPITSAHAIERYLVTTLYFALQGDRWDSRLRFLSQRSVCDWNVDDGDDIFGVTCFRRTGLVDSIVLEENKLIGRLPNEIGMLSRLNFISMSGNAISGPLPQSLSNLSNLFFLNLQYNQLRGEIPEFLFSVPRLVGLLLSGNELLSGTIPTTISPSLEFIEIFGCSLMGPIPTQLALLTNLVYFDLNDNWLNGTIPDLGSLTFLTVFDVSSNDLASFGDGFFSNLPRFLRTLDVGDNFLTGSIPSSVFNLPSLQRLDISDNNCIVGTLPSVISPTITHLSLFSCCFNGTIPNEVASHPNITELNLADNFFTGTIPNMNKFSPLRELVLADNAFSAVGSSFFADLPVSLQILNLSGNKITGTLPSNVTYPWNLTQFIVNENLFSGTIPVSLTSLANIVRLFLQDNRFTGVIPTMEGPKLKDIFVGKNQLSSFQDGFFHLLPPLLENLDISINQLAGRFPHNITFPSGLLQFSTFNNMMSGSIPASLTTLQSLSVLVLSNNKFTGKIPSFETVKLQRVYLESNQFSGAVPPSIVTLPDLEIVLLASNQFTGTVPILFSPALKVASFANNKFSEVQDGFFTNLPQSLEQLNILNNQLVGTLPDNISYPPTLTRFAVSRNMLSGTIPKSLASLPNLVYLFCRNNQFTGEIPIIHSQALQQVTLNTNQFTSIQEGFISNVSDSLTVLQLGRNDLEPMIIDTSIVRLTSLQVLGLGVRNLVGTLPTELGLMTSLQQLYLSGNSLTGSLPSELGSLEFLRILWVHNNDFQGTIPEEIQKLSNLGNVLLNGNNFKGDVSNLFCTEMGEKRIETSSVTCDGVQCDCCVDVGVCV